MPKEVIRMGCFSDGIKRQSVIPGIDAHQSKVADITPIPLSNHKKLKLQKNLGLSQGIPCFSFNTLNYFRL